MVELEHQPRPSDSKFGFSILVENPDSGARPPVSMTVSPSLTTCVPLARCPRWQNRDDDSDYFLGLLKELNELIFPKQLVLGLAHGRSNISVNGVFFLCGT